MEKAGSPDDYSGVGFVSLGFGRARYIIEQTSFDFGEYLAGKDTVDLHMNIESSDSTQKVYYFRIGDTTSIDNSIVRTKVFTVSKIKNLNFLWME